MQPINPAVKASVAGRDCSPIILGFGFGDNTVEQAMVKNLTNPGSVHPDREIFTPITRLRSIAYYQGVFFNFGKHCVTVTGEP